MKYIKKLFISILSLLMLINIVNINAVQQKSISTELSCYINAMGGVEFGEPLLKSSVLNINNNEYTITLHLTKSQVEIYSVVCDTFIDASSSDEMTGSIKNGTIGYYRTNGQLSTSDVSYTLSQDTAKNSKNEDIHYVEWMKKET